MATHFTFLSAAVILIISSQRAVGQVNQPELGQLLDTVTEINERITDLNGTLQNIANDATTEEGVLTFSQYSDLHDEIETQVFSVGNQMTDLSETVTQMSEQITQQSNDTNAQISQLDDRMTDLSQTLQTLITDINEQFDTLHGKQGTCNSNYFLLHGEMTWLEALFACVERDAHLAKIRSDEQMEEVRGLLSTYQVYIGGTRGFWIGGNDIRTEGNYVYVDGEPLRYYNWHPSEPNDGGGHEDCMEILPRDPHRWNDQSCDTTRWVLCEMNCAD